jgi:hypothetical protein
MPKTRAQRDHITYLGAAMAGLSFGRHGACTLGPKPALHLGFRAITGSGQRPATHRPPSLDDGAMLWGLG